MQTLVNIDLPWNPSRLEQRKGRIQRIGQRAECINIYYLQYKDSIDDKVFAKLSERLQGQHDLFDELPDCFEDVWVNCIKDIKTGLDSFAHDIDKSKEKCKLNQSFKDRYTDPKRNGSTLNWESCSEVLSAIQAKNILMQEW